MTIQIATATGPIERDVEILFDHFGHTFVGHGTLISEQDGVYSDYTISELSTGRKLISDFTREIAIERGKRFLESKGSMFFKEILKRHPVLNAVEV